MTRGDTTAPCTILDDEADAILDGEFDEEAAEFQDNKEENNIDDTTAQGGACTTENAGPEATCREL